MAMRFVVTPRRSYRPQPAGATTQATQAGRTSTLMPAARYRGPMRRGGVHVAAVLVMLALFAAPAAADRVLRVGTYHGIPGEFTDVQAAVNAAAPNDWILIAPGDYHEAQTPKPSGAQGGDQAGAAVLITKPGLWLRGMDRNRVWIDGTRPGSSRCSSADSAQDLGPSDAAGKPGGRNGILVYKTKDVIVENLSLCNFLTGDLGAGNAIWWDGGGSTGTQSSLGVWWGNYLTATSSYYKDANSPSAGYGIYSSNTAPPGYGVFAHDYASNMNDSAYYVGACPDCEVTLNDVHGENAPQGYSGTNSGGHVLIENSEFDKNGTGFATGDLNNDDAPGPQDGTCPGNAVNPNAPNGIQRTHVCWELINNYIHDNNNADTPSQGVAGAVPVGTGITIYGGRHDIIWGNRITNNGAWGIAYVPFPDTSNPPPVAHCNGGADLSAPGQPFCFYDDFGGEMAGNTFTNNGYFGNPSNGDIAELSQSGGPTGPNYNPDSNCFHDNTDTSGTLTSDPANIDSRNQCGSTYSPANDPVYTAQVSCDSQLVASCPAGTTYPRATDISLTMPPAQKTMPNPCAGVPADPWCSGQVTRVKACMRRLTIRVPAALAPRQRLVALTGRIKGMRGAKVVRHGKSVTVTLPRRAHGLIRVTVSERIKVRGHVEHFSFTRVYRGC